MIIDAHAHLLAPPTLYAYKAQLLADAGVHAKSDPGVGDDELAEFAARNVAVMDGVGTDVQLVSPRPFQQMHSATPARIVHRWIRANNDVIARTVAMHPDRFAGVAGLPLAAGQPIETCLDELRRGITELGFVGVLLNPDPTEGRGTPPPLGDPFWYPLWETMVELDVPALVHSAGCYSDRETYSEHFITEESIAILTALRSNLFDDFPQLKLIISHGGGSVPYQVGRWQAERLHPGFHDVPPSERFEQSLRRFWFDTVLHHPPSLELLIRLVGTDRCLFGTERPGSGSARNPDTGRDFDDLRPVIEGFDFLDAAQRAAIFEDNARALFSRLSAATPSTEARDGT